MCRAQYFDPSAMFGMSALLCGRDRLLGRMEQSDARRRILVLGTKKFLAGWYVDHMGIYQNLGLLRGILRRIKLHRRAGLQSKLFSFSKCLLDFRKEVNAIVRLGDADRTASRTFYPGLVEV